MNKHEFTVLSSFLEDLSDKFSRAGCNDYEMENTDENWELLKAAERWNYSDKEDWTKRRPKGKTIQTFDSLILDYLKHLLDKEIEEMK